MPGSHSQKLRLRIALVCYSNIHKGSEASIRKCQTAELLALTHHKGELKHGVGLQSTGKHMVAGHTADLLGFRPNVHFSMELSATCLLGCTAYKQTKWERH